MIKFATTTDASLTEMWCLQLIGKIVHNLKAQLEFAQTLAKSTDETLRS